MTDNHCLKIIILDCEEKIDKIRLQFSDNLINDLKDQNEIIRQAYDNACSLLENNSNGLIRINKFNLRNNNIDEKVLKIYEDLCYYILYLIKDINIQLIFDKNLEMNVFPYMLNKIDRNSMILEHMYIK